MMRLISSKKTVLRHFIKKEHMKKLFNMFTQPKDKKVEAALADVLAFKGKVENNTTSTNAIVEQIHHEFFTAADRLLEEARSIIAGTDENSIAKSKRLESLGFTSAREVAKDRDLRMRSEMSKETVKLIETYHKKYPGYKFITTEQARHICGKYDLYIGPTARYKGFVPEKNLVEIEKFISKHNIFNNVWIQTRQGDLLILEDAEIFQDGSYSHVRKRGTKGGYGERAFQMNGRYSDRNTAIYGDDARDLFELADYGNVSGAVVVPVQLGIAAPIADMDVNNTQIKDRTISEIITYPDPVVLSPVMGGYIIVTAWGDEAEDPIVKG